MSRALILGTVKRLRVSDVTQGDDVWDRVKRRFVVTI